jgi:dTDP-4-dehydrorhamnose 3,5-epimerase
MIFTESKLQGAFTVTVERIHDHRGFFARTWSSKEFLAHGIEFLPDQNSVSYNLLRGTLRGIHYQVAPYQECKLVRCARGAIFDVIIDLRPGSATYKSWFGLELTAANCQMLYVPNGFAHGFQTLVDDTEVVYLMSDAYNPDAERGIRWNDPGFAIPWPIDVRMISDKDLNWPEFPR